MTAPNIDPALLGSSTNRLNAIWIDWGHHPRTHSLVRNLGIELVEIDEAGGRARRYFVSARLTLQAIKRLRPRVVFATNPSIALGYLLLILRVWYRFTLISDAHYAGVRALTNLPFFQTLIDFHNRRADLVIVTNQGHSEHLRRIGARPHVCPDPLPEVQTPRDEEFTLPDKSVFLICSFDLDEPYQTVFEAFASLSKEGFALYVSGNHRKAGINPGDHPEVRFIGFVPESVYHAHLHRASLVMDLTILEDCLACGAYEALAAGRPLILAGSKASRAYFDGACHYTEIDPSSIARTVRDSYENRQELSKAARRWSSNNESYMRGRIEALVAEARELAAPASGIG